MVTTVTFYCYDDVMRFAVSAGFLLVISGLCQAGSPTPISAESKIVSASIESSVRPTDEVIEKIEVFRENIREVLSRLFESKNNVYKIDPQVQGYVTLSLSKAPFHFVLETLLSQIDGTYRQDSGSYIVELKKWPVASEQTPTLGEAAGDKMISISSNSDEEIRDFLTRIFDELDVSFAISPKIEGKAYGRFNSMKLKDVLARLGEVHGFYAELRSGCYVVQPLLQQGMNLVPPKSNAIYMQESRPGARVAAPTAPLVEGQLPSRRLSSVSAADEFTALLRKMGVRFRINPNLPRISGTLPRESNASRLYRIKRLARASILSENGVLVVRPLSLSRTAPSTLKN